MNPQEEKAYKEQMKYHKINNKHRLKMHLGSLWLLHSLAAKSPLPSLAVKLHRARGTKIGKDCLIGDNVHLDLLHPELITIEDNVTIGMRTMIFTHRSHWSPDLEDIYPKSLAPVLIKRGAWIAPGCIILQGVTIGENSVVGAGSIVVKDVDPYTVVAGNPAKLIKRIN